MGELNTPPDEDGLNGLDIEPPQTEGPFLTNALSQLDLTLCTAGPPHSTSVPRHPPTHPLARQTPAHSRDRAAHLP